ncbi:RNA polymerase sigma factor [Actinocrispum wychmicini]|uniref:RNA polymerase sigma-70 factor (ECF subfamily) n=1 Tax=Actinocrispum wychmicini TaxID=1213861 RepID=A0A4R2J8Z8_9PSEU|nr:SigE family RNA polymerase sigma factor [Actinocrispum wychmicini]TCO53038.1 RNA polymerase sigma-70 factor (ECF subfamily) [Actinocrispum wychmicini]
MTDEWFAELYEGCYRHIVVTAYGLTGDLGDAEEIAQETFAIAYSRRRRVRATDNPRGWLHTVAVHLAKRRRRRRMTLDRLLRKEIPPPPVWVGEHTELHAAIRGLSVDHRAVVVLHYLADLPVDEVASVLGIAVGTVKSRLSRARTALAEKLAIDREVENA